MFQRNCLIHIWLRVNTQKERERERLVPINACTYIYYFKLDGGMLRNQTDSLIFSEKVKFIKWGRLTVIIFLLVFKKTMMLRMGLKELGCTVLVFTYWLESLIIAGTIGCVGGNNIGTLILAQNVNSTNERQSITWVMNLKRVVLKKTF